MTKKVQPEYEGKYCTKNESGEDCFFLYFDTDTALYRCSLFRDEGLDFDKKRRDPYRCQACLDHERSLVQEKEESNET